MNIEVIEKTDDLLKIDVSVNSDVFVNGFVGKKSEGENGDETENIEEIEKS